MLWPAAPILAPVGVWTSKAVAIKEEERISPLRAASSRVPATGMSLVRAIETASICVSAVALSFAEARFDVFWSSTVVPPVTKVVSFIFLASELGAKEVTKIVM